LTGFLGKSMASGSFGIALKKAGFDGILIKGKASEPVFISIINGTSGLHKAGHVWGKGTFDTCKIIREQMGNQKVRIAAIGPAGENLVKIAAVITDERRAFGRTGIGAVMGSKLLKAIVVRGDKRMNVAEEKHLLELNKKHLLVAPQTSRGGGLKANGTGGGVLSGALSGNLPIRNWTRGTWPDAEKITCQTFMPQYKYGSGEKVCGEEVLCSIHCERRISVKDSKYGESIGKGPEYETLGALGSMTLINNILAIIKANDLCDDLGLDTISTGTSIAWAMEAYEKGILSDTDIGFPLKWGDEDATIKLLDMIAFKRGVGELLSEGVKEA
jgi:aldehyde:ferredoxin oxidoreductase